MPAYAKAATAALAAKDLWAQPGHLVSPLGTDKAVKLPHFLQKESSTALPWGSRTAKNTNPYSSPPNTGVTRHYSWTITQETCAPDGVAIPCNLINGQFPGPTLEANWGDWIEVQVTNNIPDEGTSIHWHGLLQSATPYMDGVPGNTQCPIAPNSSFTYLFQADLYGTSWYHSHYSAQYASGVVGPMVIYGPTNADYDADLGPVMITDWFDEYYTAAIEKTLASPQSGQAGPPLATNNLINGKTNNGGNGIATFSVTSGKSYRIRLINHSAASTQRFTIDGYNMTIFANDFVPVEPYVVEAVTLGIGQRTDVIFTASGSPTDSVWMRAYRPPLCGPSTGNEEVLAAIFYENADTSVPPTTEPGPAAYLPVCGNDPLSQTVPYYPMTPPEPDVNENIVLNFTSNGTALLWYWNGQTFRIDYNDPMLLDTKEGNAANFPAIRNAHIFPGSVNSIRFVIENPVAQPHPMHLHGHNFWVLQEGACASVPSSPPPPETTPAWQWTTEAVTPTWTNLPTGWTTPAGWTTSKKTTTWTSTKTSTWSSVWTSTKKTSTTKSTWTSTTTSCTTTTSSSWKSTTTTTTHPWSYSTTSSTTTTTPTGPWSYSITSTSTTTPAPPPYSTSTSTTTTNTTTSAIPTYKKREEGEAKVKYSYQMNPKRQAAPPANSCWDGSIVNPQNPQRRDVQILAPNSYIVLQWVQDNPGVWPLHCHIAWHLSAGMAYMVVENPEAVQANMQIPSILQETCTNWQAWSNSNVVDEIGDGI